MVQVLQFVQTDTELGFQAGVIGHVPLTDKVNGFAKAGWGNDIKQTYQSRCSIRKYALISI